MTTVQVAPGWDRDTKQVTRGDDPRAAGFEADMGMLIEATQKAADKADFDRLPHDRKRALIEAESKRRGLRTKILIEDED